MLQIVEKEMLKDNIEKLLLKVGMKVENEEILARLLKYGFKETPSGRISIAKENIDEMVRYQKKTQKEDAENQSLHLKCGIDWAHSIIWRKEKDKVKERLGKEFLMSAFDCGPTKYYDYSKKQVCPVDTNVFIEMMKFAHATPEIGYISTWYRQDAPEKIERIDSLILGFKYTDKVDGIEAIYPEQIKYLKEIGEIVSNAPENTPYLAGSQCITSPLILERRSASEMLERVKRNVNRYHVASMPTIGISTPVTIAGSVVMTAAEILGGMVIAYCLDSDADISGRAISLVVDMRNGNNTPSGPEPTMVNLAVRELFDTFWGGHLWVEVFLSPYTKMPGLQATYENFYGVHRYSKLVGNSNIPYPGMGTLDNGGVGSPTQFMLDMEIRKSEFHTANKIKINEETLPFHAICESVRDEKGFLDSEHTLKHFKELWQSNIFLTDNPTSGGWEGDEKTILDKCDELWMENIKNYRPPEWPEDKIKALNELLIRAKKELL
ncbi:MAG: trimethylamine methyltransferase family protein [Candidatus Omnitrophica bacterium]|nr:trimethylamine methyltransferase family protein [Candidatus Omnitrophota bacterium]